MLERDNQIINLIEKLEKGNESYKLTFLDKDSNMPSDLLIDSSFKKNENNNFEICFTASNDELGNRLDSKYFMSKPTFLVAYGGLITGIENFNVISVRQGIQEDLPNKYTIEVNAFRQGIEPDMWIDSRQKAYIKYNKEIFNPNQTAIPSEIQFSGRNDKNALHLTLDNTDFIFYYEDVDEKYGYFIFDANGLISFDKFKKIIETVATAYGFVTGFYMLDCIYYFSFKKGYEKSSPLAYHFENVSKVSKSDNAIMKNGHYEDIPKDRITLSMSQFNNLVNNLYKDEELFRSAMLLITATQETGCAKASLAAVALETITKQIDTNSSTGKIIEDKTLANGVRYELKKVVKEYKGRITEEQANLLQNKIDNINTNLNSNKLEEAFKALGIFLKTEEIECIKTRNLFLHGNQPKKIKDIQYLREDEILNIMSNRLVMLSSILLLKMSKFEGMVVDWGMTEVIKWRMIRKGELPPNGYFLRDISQKEIEEDD